MASSPLSQPGSPSSQAAQQACVQELASLRKVIQIINRLAEETDIQAAMDNVRHTAHELLNCEKVTLFLVFDRRQELRGITHGPAGEFVIKVKFGEGIAGTVAATGELMNIADTYAHPLFNSAVDRTTGFRTHNMLCCAISDMSGKNVAVLQALNKRAGEVFTGADEKSLKLVGTHLGNTLAKAKLHETAKRERNRLTALYTFFKSMAASDTLDELLLLVRMALHDILQAEHAFVFLLDAPRKELWCNYTIPGKAEPGGARVSLGAGLVGMAAEERRVRVLGADGNDNQRRVHVMRSSSACSTPSANLSQSGRASHSLSGTSWGLGTGNVPVGVHANLGSNSKAPSGRHSHPMPERKASSAGARDGTQPGYYQHSPPSAYSPNLIDPALMRQIAPVLGDTPIVSVLVQPLLAPDDKLMGAILVVNKQEMGCRGDILYEDYFTDSDVEAMALFALELGSTLSDRSLECALASALSVVGHDGRARGKSPLPSDPVDSKEGSEANHELLLRSQLISMYFQPGPDYRRMGSDGSGPLSPLMSMSSSSNRRWQRSLTKLVSVQRLSLSHGRLRETGALRSDEQGCVVSGSPGASGSCGPWSTPGAAVVPMRTQTAEASLDQPRHNLPSRRSVQPHDLMPGAAAGQVLTEVDLSMFDSSTGLDTGGVAVPPGTPAESGPLRPPLDLIAAFNNPASPFYVPALSPVETNRSEDGRLVAALGERRKGLDGEESDKSEDGSSERASLRSKHEFTRQLSELAATLMHHAPSAVQDSPPHSGPPSQSQLQMDESMLPEDAPSFSVNLTQSQRAMSMVVTSPTGVNGGSSVFGNSNGGAGVRSASSGSPVSLAVTATVQQPLHRLSNMGLATGTGPPENFVLQHHVHLQHASSLGRVALASASAGQLRHNAAHAVWEHPSAGQGVVVGAGSNDGPGRVSPIQGGSPRAQGSAGGGVPLPPVAHNNSGRRSFLADGVTATFFDPVAIHSWHFDFTQLDDGELVKLCYDLFLLSGLVSHFNLNRKTLRAFLTAVASHHHAIPYHNFNHVCHVLHGVCLFIRTDMVRRSLPPEDRLALMIAALCHDMDHDGCSNAYHINIQSELARIYNDTSVMENHHCAMTFAILRRKDCALLDCLETDVRRRIRKSIISAILSTDMSHHFALTQEFKRHPVVYDLESEADRLLMIKVLLHASDIGSAVRPFKINDTLSSRVHQEFAALADKELLAGLPITFAVDPENPRMCAQVECNFLDYVVTPLWERLGEVIPDLQSCYDQLLENRQMYEQRRIQRSPSGTGAVTDGAQPPAEGAGQ